MLLAFLYGCDLVCALAVVTLHRAVDETGVGSWWTGRAVQGANVHSECSFVEPIRQGHGSKIGVVVCGCWSVDDDTSHDAVAILSRVVAVVPGSAELCAANDILFALAGGDGAFCHAVHAVVLAGIQLTEAVPVDRSTVVLKGILDVDDERIAPVGVDGRAG